MNSNVKQHSISHINLAAMGLLALMAASIAKATPVITYPYNGAVLTGLDRILGYDTVTTTNDVKVALLSMDGDAAWNGIDRWIPTPGPWLGTFLNSDKTWTAPGGWVLPKLSNGNYRIYAVSTDKRTGKWSSQVSVYFTIKR